MAENKTPANVESLIDVEFTVLGSTDLDRFDVLLDRFIDADDGMMDPAELQEFSDMVVYARRVDGKD